MIAGASFKSILGSKNLSDPAADLQAMNRFFASILANTSNIQMNNGMDVGVCYFNHDAGTLTFAGAKQSLLILENDHFTEIKGNKKSIGYLGSDKDMDFTNHQIKTSAHTQYYLYSDGLADQIGGDKKLPFGRKKLKKLLKKTKTLPLIEQKIIIQTEFNAYQGNEPQRDDITLVGFKV
jgi:serine phosphatase RsbU (regulator of sigma subunit)